MIKIWAQKQKKWLAKITHKGNFPFILSHMWRSLPNKVNRTFYKLFESWYLFRFWFDVIVQIEGWKDIYFCLSLRKKYFLWHMVVIRVGTQKFLVRKVFFGQPKKKIKKNNFLSPKVTKFCSKKNKNFPQIKDFWENWGFTDNFRNSIKNFLHRYICLKSF